MWLPRWYRVKNLLVDPGDGRDSGLIPGSGRSSGVGNGSPLKYSSLENSMDRGAWRAVHGISKRWTRLRIHACTALRGTVYALSLYDSTWKEVRLSQSVSQFSHSVVSDSLRPHELQHAMPPCPSPTPGVHSDSHPSSQ